jgi:hypothetical protein
MENARKMSLADALALLTRGAWGEGACAEDGMTW